MREIKQAQILPFLRYLNKSFDVYLPIKKNNDWVFNKLDCEAETINTKSVMTMLPPKKFFLPHNEKTFSAFQNEIHYDISAKPIVLFGVNTFDINALTLLDQIMSKPYNDPYYWEKRKKTIVIGIGPERINVANYGYDLFLEEQGDSFLAISGSTKGSELIASKYFENSTKIPKKIFTLHDPIFNEIDKIQKAMNSSYGKKVWEKVAQTCFGCGICAYVCPLCYCHEYEDEFNLDCSTCRKRKWDACFLPDFFAVAGHNSREKLPNRIFNWYYHKFVRMPQEYGRIGCIDCGRCIEYCPAKINFKEVLKELIKK